MYQNLTPLDGFNDITGKEARLREYISEKITGIYVSNGYEKIDIPMLETQQLFSPEFVGVNPWPGWHPRSLFSLTVKDYKGAYENTHTKETNMFLIPEVTASVCRYVAKELSREKKNFPSFSKYYYLTKCFRNELVCEVKETKKREFTQIGVELIGQSSVYTDLENFDLVFKVLESLGIKRKDIVLRYSDVRLFNFLVEKTGLSSYEQNRLKVVLDDIASTRAKGCDVEDLIKKFEGILCELNLDSTSKELWKKLLLRFENLDDLKKDLKDFPSGVVNNLVALEKLFKGEYSDNFSVDLSIIRGQDYYNQTTFQVDVNTPKGIISEIGGGGRYDFFISKILSSEDHFPATGMAFSIERLHFLLTEYFSEKEIVKFLSRKGIVLWCKDIYKALAVVDDFRLNYDIVEVSYHGERADAKEYAGLKSFDFKEIK